MLRNCIICLRTNRLDATHLVQINTPVSFLSNMLETTPIMGWGEDVDVLRTCTHLGCYATGSPLYSETFRVGFGNLYSEIFPGGFGNFSGWIRKLSGWIRKLSRLYSGTYVFGQVGFGN